jgi:hypothetical protein
MMSQTLATMLANPNLPFITPAAFEDYRVTNRNYSEMIQQPLYDHNLLEAAGYQTLQFFQQQQGQGRTTTLGATANTGKTSGDTNMQLSGQLPSGMEFIAQAIEVSFYPGSVSTANTYTPATTNFFNATAAATVGNLVNDVNTFYQSGVLEFNILNKNYFRQGPLINFPPTRNFTLEGYASTNSAAAALYGAAVLKASGLPQMLDPFLALQSSVNFDVTLRNPAVVAMPSGFNARVGVTLLGYQLRAGQ